MPIRTGRPRRKKPRARVKERVVYVPAPTPVSMQKPDSELELALKRVLRSPAAQKVLEAAERDPDAFVNGIKRSVEGIEKLYAFFQQRPDAAKRATRNAVIAAAAHVARRKLSGG